MAIKANIDLEKLREIINQHNAAGASLYIDSVVINPDEDRLTQVMLGRHCREVRINEIIPVGSLWTSTVPMAIIEAVIDKEQRERHSHTKSPDTKSESEDATDI